MLTLLLLRHAKSSWDDQELDDFDRGLSERGRLAAPVLGRFIAQHDLVPQRILCSSARRTQETLQLILPTLAAANGGSPLPVDIVEDLYLASEHTLLAHARRLPLKCRRALMIGHNPGLHDFAMGLAGAGDVHMRHDLAVKFPTAAIAVLTFPGATWAAIAPKAGTLVEFTTPRRLSRASPNNAN